MKIAPIYMTKPMLVNKLNKRNNKIAEKYVEISEDLPPKSIDLLNKFRLSFAKIARRKNCKLLFSKGEDGTQMNVVRKHLHWHHHNVPQTYITNQSGGDLTFPLVYSVAKKEGGIYLPNELDPKNILFAVKRGIKTIIESVKDEKTMHFHFPQN